ncbi:MAG TPA: PSD1 and planctomycete cytochrome C domain-containing protein [Bryobacteraceae bacterium]|nr:PSD1 and planctomycete cytochrome C domain-containing protein [Bryobacteraceae bacterium]
MPALRSVGAVACAAFLCSSALHAADPYGILQRNCFPCHGAAKTSGLDLRTAESMMTGGAHGGVIVPGDPEQSRLYKLITHVAEPAMPPGKKLSDDDIETIRVWIEAGSPYPKVDAKETDAAEKAAMAKLEQRPITPAEQDYWAFRPVRAVTPPKVSEAAWNHNPIDRFALAAMKAKGLKPSARADKRTLVRRAYLDLTGLPPTPADVDAFVKDASADAWTKLVDKLLASPHYGERWARHWMDLARYADSDGFEFDRERPEAWRYRDYLVNAFNNDKPYDQFIREQLAGDEYVTKSTPAAEAQEKLIATGFLRLGPSGGGGGERGKQDSLDDIITVTSMTFMGMTVGCARCHNHKFDPIPQKDYYQMQAVFYSTRPYTYPLVATEEVAKYRAEANRITELQRPYRKAKADLEEPYRKRLVDEAISKLPDYMQTAWRTPSAQRTDGQKLNVRQIEKTLNDDTLAHKIDEPMIVSLMTDEERKKHQELNDRIEQLDNQKPPMYPTAMAITDSGPTPQPSYFLQRGVLDARGTVMQPGVLTVASLKPYVYPAPPPDAKTTWRRRGFAEWISSPENPLTARVMANRIWQHHFGEGIVRTPSNFGKMGEQPSHPELLDWLAAQFVEHGWSMKAMHRLIMNSELYQVSSDDNMADVAIDPENRYFWRMPRERMEAEVLRDEVLAVSGKIDLKTGGPCIFPWISPDIFQGSSHRTWTGKPDDDPSTWRRSIYVFSKRSIRYPLFEAYDQPNLINTCDRRNRSTIAPQALLLMNNNFVITQARYFAERLRQEAGTDPAAQVNRAFLLALGRAPSASERASSLSYLSAKPARLAGFCQAMFNLNEFAYRP